MSRGRTVCATGDSGLDHAPG